METGGISSKVTEDFSDSQNRVGVPCTLICLATARNLLLWCYWHGTSLLTMGITQLKGKH